VVTLWSDLGVDWISFSEPLAAQANPLAYYDGLHFNAEGYRMTAEFLAEHLRHASDPDEDGQVRSGAS